MTRRQVTEIVCSRCGKGEIQTEKELNGIEPNIPEFTITLHNKTIEYSDLCTRCRKVLKNYYLKITNSEDKDEAKPREPQKKGGLLSIGKK